MCTHMCAWLGVRVCVYIICMYISQDPGILHVTAYAVKWERQKKTRESERERAHAQERAKRRKRDSACERVRQIAKRYCHRSLYTHARSPACILLWWPLSWHPSSHEASTSRTTSRTCTQRQRRTRRPCMYEHIHTYITHTYIHQDEIEDNSLQYGYIDVWMYTCMCMYKYAHKYT